MIFNNINVSGEEMWETEHHDVPNKIKLGFEIGLPVNDKNNFQKQYQLQLSRRSFVLFTMIFIWINKWINKMNNQIKKKKFRLQVKAYKSRVLQWWNMLYIGPNKAPKNYKQI